MAEQNMKEKRIRERRVSFHSDRSKSLKGADRNSMHKDRRRIPDRRLNNLWLELVTLKPGDIPFDWGHKMHLSIKKASAS